MKKSQIVLTAIAVLTVVGGTLAFSAQKKGSRVWTTDAIDQPAIHLVSDSKLTTPGNGVETFASAQEGANAADTYTTFQQ